MANNSSIGTITWAAGAVPTVFPTNPAAGNSFFTGAASNLVVWVKFVTDGASNFTSFDIQIVDSYDGTAGSWLVNPCVENVNGATASTQNVLVSAGATKWAKFQTSSTRVTPNGMSVFLRANGGAVQPADAATIYISGW